MPQFALSPDRATDVSSSPHWATDTALSPKGATPAPHLSRRDLETARWLLESHRDARLDQVAALALLPDEDGPPGERLPGVAATSRDGLLQAALAVLEEIEFAIQRLDDGSYGHCVTCGEAVDVGCLMREPHVPHCVRCVADR
jgi:hypothetical protein